MTQPSRSYLPSPPGVGSIFTYPVADGTWRTEQIPLVGCSISADGYLDAVDLAGNVMGSLDSGVVMAFILADGRVIDRDGGIYLTKKQWLDSVKREYYQAIRRRSHDELAAELT